jgi:polycomb protein EED
MNHHVAAGVHSAGEVDVEPVRLEFIYNRSIKEDKQIYSIQCIDDLFAAVGGNTASVYRINEDSSVELLLAYVDLDATEVFYTCAWSLVEEPILLLGGLTGSVKAISILRNELSSCLIGHGNSINEIKVHPVDENLVLTASKDESIRLWNLKTNVCIAIFSGHNGHRDEVLSIAIHPLGNCFVSGGMDCCLKIWTLENIAIRTLIQNSYAATDNAIPTVKYIQFPEFSTNVVHNNYIDSVNWYGNFILSNAVSDKVCLWAPDSAHLSVCLYCSVCLSWKNY